MNALRNTFSVRFGKLNRRPNSLAQFQPARVTSIEGKIVKGASGAGSPCPKCIVEVFLDDVDDVTEAKQFLASTQAGADGKWTVTLPTALQADEGLRTTSTTQSNGVIAGMSAGTTTVLSDGSAGLYRPQQSLFLPSVLRYTGTQ